MSDVHVAPNNTSVKCSRDTTMVFRWMDGKLWHYPNPTVAGNWDSKWYNANTYTCSDALWNSKSTIPDSPSLYTSSLQTMSSPLSSTQTMSSPLSSTQTMSSPSTMSSSLQSSSTLDMSCPGIPNFDTITINNLENEYKKLTNDSDKAKFKSCLKNKYSSILLNSQILPNLLLDYDKRLERNVTATEKNEQSRQQYITDVFYLIFKLVIFVILGFFYYVFIKNPQTAIESVKGATEMVKEATESIKTSIEDIKK
jgi:hypothetical protein